MDAVPDSAGSAGGDGLPSWRETAAKQAIAAFVAAVTDPDSAGFVPPQDRIAVFDNDGTLWTEQPMYAQLAFALDRAAELGRPTSLEQLRAGGMAAQKPSTCAAICGNSHTVSCGPSARTTARNRAFSSWRTLPGQE